MAWCGDRDPVGGRFLRKACEYTGMISLTFQQLRLRTSAYILLHVPCDSLLRMMTDVFPGWDSILLLITFLAYSPFSKGHHDVESATGDQGDTCP